MSDNPSFKRRILHLDMDAFFASVEQRDFPEYQGKPIAVGGGKRGVVAAASYEARKFGVRSAMPTFMAIKKCPDIIFVRGRYAVYKEVSQQIMQIFKSYSPLVEPLSLDEAYIDISDNIRGFKSAKETAMAIKEEVKQTTQLTISAGVSFNKFLAKIASGMNKPDGLTIISPQKAPAFINKLPIEQFFGVGEKTAAKMKKFGIFTGKDLLDFGPESMENQFGKMGIHLYRMATLQDFREVKTNRIRKSIGAERTFENNIESFGLIMLKLNEVLQHLERYLSKKKVKGKTITLKIKYRDFTQITRSKTIEHYTNSIPTIREIVKQLVQQEEIKMPIRLIGVSLSNLDTEGKKENNKKPKQQVEQLNFFDDK